jgi:hypothetical protein
MICLRQLAYGDLLELLVHVSGGAIAQDKLENTCYYAIGCPGSYGVHVSCRPFLHLPTSIISLLRP